MSPSRKWAAGLSSAPWRGCSAPSSSTRARRSETGAARDAIAQRLAEGDVLVLFPEGTSNDGNSVLPFKSALLAAADTVLADGPPVPVQPVSTAYVARQGIPMGRENRPLYAWYGDMELVPHLWEALKAGPLDVVVQFHAPLPAMDRKELAKIAWETVRKGQAAGGCRWRRPRCRHLPPAALAGQKPVFAIDTAPR